jgi:DNA recombination protein RmuC
VFAEHLEKVGKGLETASKGYNSAVGSFNGRLLPGARETAELAGDLERIPDELEPAATVLREVNGRALPSGG